jgi:hypothetical protein
VLAIEGKLLPQKQIFSHESSSRLKSRPQELAEVRSETEENRNEAFYLLHSSGILPNGHRYGNGKDSGSNTEHESEKTAGFLHFASPLLVFAHHKDLVAARRCLSTQNTTSSQNYVHIQRTCCRGHGLIIKGSSHPGS